MLEPVEGVPLFARETRAETILEACDGSGTHVPFPATLEGLRASADEMVDEMAGAAFPRAEIAAALDEYGRAIGAPSAALANASRIAEPGALVVATGQQPLAFGGPMYVLYKAATAVRLAREAEAALGGPVIPVFWSASEDHDLDEVARAAAPGPGGEVLRYRADLSAWRGREARAVGPDGSWQAPAREWAEALPGDMADFAPREGEGWARWYSRLISDALGPEGLVVIEPQPLRALSGAVFAKAVREREEIARLISRSCEERAGEGGPRQFGGLGGPPLFMKRDGRRLRLIDSGSRLGLKGAEATYEPDELATLAEAEPDRFSSHAALRPIVQNALLPVVAQVMGPGEIAYHEELCRYHASAAGAGRRMPVMWPRLSATVLDRRAAGTMARFGVGGADVFADEAALVRRFTPAGDVSKRIEKAGRDAATALQGLDEEATALDATLAKPLAKTLGSVARAFGAFAAKAGAAEARARGFAPEKLRRLAAWVAPGGQPQERVFAWTWGLAQFGGPLASRLVEELDVTSRMHHLIRVDEGDEGGQPDAS
ncbi:MAG: bacillithiol biosynthesis cysteine-adding enzyme BshC [Planctomycetota bacterium]|jgi:bacillithiol biosynthesis cysteine-adding enzyme BshC